MPADERVQRRCRQQCWGEGQGQGESGAWGPAAVSHLLGHTPRRVWSAQPGSVVLVFIIFFLITKAIRCACRTSKSPKPSPEVTSLLTCIVNPSSLFASAHGRHFLFLQKEDVLHRFFFIQHSTAQHPPVLLPGDLMLLLSLGGYVHSTGLEVRILAPWLCHIGQLASAL